MSIAVLTQVYDETRRLAVAGSAVARGDFRLKKLLPALDQAGAKAPVFAKVAECARAVIDGAEEQSAERLLELGALVTAVLYTQGETGLAGDLKPIETIDLGAVSAQTSARLLKPLLEALRSTGSGRLELVRDAFERGAFRDPRLVQPALDALDDPYAEIADFLADKVLPLYGQAIVPQLRSRYDPKATRGHPRRLRLMHAIDPVGTRVLIQQALEAGSKEVKVAAIACLGANREDLDYLVEQAGARAQEVRAAAYAALAGIVGPEAAAVLASALAGKDMHLAAAAFQGAARSPHVGLLVAAIEKEWAGLPTLKDRKEAGEHCRRLATLIGALPGEAAPEAEAALLDWFTRRAELAKVKGDNFSGADAVEALINRMLAGSERLRTALADAHAELSPAELRSAFLAAEHVLPPAEVYERFAPYVAANVDDKKKGKDAAWSKRQAIVESLGGTHIYYYHLGAADRPPRDPRWLDLAVAIRNLPLIQTVGRPDHAGANALLRAEFDAALKKLRDPDQLLQIVVVMVRLQHPDAVDALLAAHEKTSKKATAYGYWLYHLIPELPKSAIPRLEAVVPTLKDAEADMWLRSIQALRDRD